MSAIEAQKCIIHEAILLARGLRCHCKNCWLDRGRHAPGCAWEEIEALRESVEELLKHDPTWLIGLPDWAQAQP